MAAPEPTSAPVGVSMSETGLDPIVLALTNRRAQLGLTYAEVTSRGGPNPASIHAWEHGHKSPTLTSLRRWSVALDFHVTWSIIPRQPTKPPP